MRSAIFGLVIATASVQANAEIVKIPETSGFSGFVSGGLKFVDYSSNTIAGSKTDDLANEVITDLGSPDNEDLTTGAFNYDLRYTLAESRTQLFLGTLLQDALRFDFSTQAGVRQEIGDMGIVSASFLFSTFPAKLYRDPFLTNARRGKTDLDSTGVRLAWDDIWGSNVNVSVSTRDQDLDDEDSGQSVGGLTGAEVANLDRNGDLNSVDISYNWVVAQGHIVTPALIYRDYDLDGDAVARDGTTLQLTYALNKDRYSLVTNLSVGQYDYDQGNPVFGGKKADSDEYGISGTFFLHKIAGIDELNGYATVAYYESDSDIDFYDQDVTMVGAGAIWSF